ncbi:MAG: ACT domain-containing protein [Candidatus Wallbacteria bacterium]|nr:ACT domain-containing protein [Candidatus Wallbacteria bacterium]
MADTVYPRPWQRENGRERLVISVMGADRPGILASITRVLADHSVNIVDITQKIIDGMFLSLIVADCASSDTTVANLRRQLERASEDLGLKAIVQQERLFRFMHRV